MIHFLKIKEKNSLITATVKMRVTREDRKMVLELISSIVGPTRAQPGCLSCLTYQDVKNQNIIIYEEKWKRQADLERHIRSNRYLNILSAIDMSSEPPEIRFDTITGTRGMEFIKAIRGGTENKENFAAETQ
jgi:quinol monooxygenase YgiN